MKKLFIFFITSAMLLLLASCGSETKETNEAESETFSFPAIAETTSAEEETETGNAVVSVMYEKDAPKGDREKFVAEKGKNDVKIVFTTDKPVKNFTILGLANAQIDEDGNVFYAAQELKTFESLKPGKQIEVTTVFYGELSNNGISYVDTDGEVKYFGVNISGYDGAVEIYEINVTLGG